ncbi:putative uncharacterized protein SPANXA2-OT1 [Plecturocebus cupreus]
MGFPHVVQAGLELLTSSGPPASASQSADITANCVVRNRGSYFQFFIFFEMESLCGPDWSAVVQSWLTATFVPQVQVILLPQPPE